ncbi:hypothetical protein NADFUDRAFT_83192 [Nadsonia fulvescens var. elongata DSM 6958]|uniref:Thioesterase domain-containing protein n=1 Tax=Nadsonia fulvescens var. elongata DSM 6958 TaxID=857566 RepID=A0A1E3PI55_9ASCO|nr:hypothetical protein NADFUDRAFT_83192 [Nadsonia fulvescens var. elongata DSM 6958]
MFAARLLTRLRTPIIASASGYGGYQLTNSLFDLNAPQHDALERRQNEASTPEYQYLQSHPIIKTLRNETIEITDSENNSLTKFIPRWKEFRQADVIPDFHKSVYLLTGLLSGEGLLNVDPIFFQSIPAAKQATPYRSDQPIKPSPEASDYRLKGFYHVGSGLATNQSSGILHQGVLTTLMDEGLCRCGFPALPNKYGVTAKLELDFIKRVHDDSYLVLNATAIETKGRKVVVQGDIRDLQSGDLIVQGQVVLVEPWWAKYLLMISNISM